MVKDANAPKRPMSGYFRFCHSIRKAVEAETGLRGVQTAPILGERWQKLDAESKAQLKAEYAAEMSVWKTKFEAYKQTDDYKNFQEQKQKKKNKKAKKMKDPNAPKRPASAYFLYLKDVRPDVVESLGTSSITEVGKKIGEMWRDLDEEEKSEYKTSAEELQAEYKENLAAYKDSASYAAFQEKKQSVLPKAVGKKAAKAKKRVVRKVKKMKK